MKRVFVPMKPSDTSGGLAVILHNKVQIFVLPVAMDKCAIRGLVIQGRVLNHACKCTHVHTSVIKYSFFTFVLGMEMKNQPRL